MSIEISLAIIAISFLVVTIFTIVALIYLIKFLKRVEKSTVNAQLKLDPILEEAHKLVQKTNMAASSVKDNIENLFTSSRHSMRMQHRFNDNGERHKDHYKEHVASGDWADWLASSILLVQRLRNK